MRAAQFLGAQFLGDLHNLLGDTHAVHVSLTDNGDDGEPARVDHVIKGDTVSEVLRYVQFDPEELLAKLRRDVEAAVHSGHLQDQQAGRVLKFYEEGLQGYTYLEDPSAE